MFHEQERNILYYLNKNSLKRNKQIKERTRIQATEKIVNSFLFFKTIKIQLKYNETFRFRFSSSTIT